MILFKGHSDDLVYSIGQMIRQCCGVLYLNLKGIELMIWFTALAK